MYILSMIGLLIMNNRNIKELVGHSGCILQLCEGKNGNWFVKKTSPNFDYNSRLEKQMLKQMTFKGLSRGVFSPKIIRSGLHSNGVFSFEMEWIEGQSVSQYIINTDVPAINLFLDRLMDEFEISYEVSDHTNIAFQEKIKSIENCVSYRNLAVRKSIDILKKFNFNNVHLSYCHGDLTLENILISNEGELFFIDFLDSFFDSWMIDAAKVLQDVELGWCFRQDPANANRDIRLALVKRKFIEKLLRLNEGLEIVNSIYHILLLNLLRIYPYANDKSTIFFLDKSVSKISNLIE